MMGWYGSGTWGLGSWLGMGLGMVLFWGLVIFGLVALLRSSTSNRQGDTIAPAHHGGYAAPPQGPAPTPQQTLDERFARGEVSEEEYRRTREILQGR